MYRVFYCGVPLWLIKMMDIVSSRTILYGPRLFVFLLSLMNDRVVQRILAHPTLNTPKPEISKFMLLYQTSWTTLIFFSRTFSNTIETFSANLVFLLCLTCVSHPFQRLILGTVISFGVFNRITFPAFILPSCLLCLYQVDFKFATQHQKKRGNAEIMACNCTCSILF